MRVASAPASLADAMTSVRTRTTWSEWVSGHSDGHADAGRARGQGLETCPRAAPPPAPGGLPLRGTCAPAISSRSRTRMKVLRTLGYSALVPMPVHERRQDKAGGHCPDRRHLQHQSAGQNRRADEELPV